MDGEDGGGAVDNGGSGGGSKGDAVEAAEAAASAAGGKHCVLRQAVSGWCMRQLHLLTSVGSWQEMQMDLTER